MTSAPPPTSTSAAIKPAGPAPITATTVMASKLHAGARCRLSNVFLGLLERALQRPGFRHVADLGEMRRAGVGRPIGWRQVDAFGFDDLDYGEGARPRAHDGAGRRVLAE